MMVINDKLSCDYCYKFNWTPALVTITLVDQNQTIRRPLLFRIQSIELHIRIVLHIQM
ncbi:hypothetical protein J4Q44_G00290850 [Coregonus suidteri]|uniref:Uncharacterized protein n=1 Tax=Coregonus suidteri TaxID=861788 RepID=A0AAN8L0B9_9TELE